MRTVVLLLAALTIGALIRCAAPREGVGGDTTVCIENDRELSMRVEIRDAGTGQEYGELWMHSFADACKDLPIPGHATVFAVIKSVSVARDIVPPAWRDMMVADPMVLIVGADGITPFAHSGRMR